MVIYLDSASLGDAHAFKDKVEGFTTNPSLMLKSGIKDYETFAKQALYLAEGKPVSFEVYADELTEMETQARRIASWGANCYVKIPVTNTKGESTDRLVKKLGMEGIKINLTAVFTLEQISLMTRALVYAPSILSIFCGRIADTGRDPMPFITNATRQKHADTKILWASTREVYNVVQARQAGADIITMTPDLIKKMALFGKDLGEYSLETVKQFHEDSKGLSL